MKIKPCPVCGSSNVAVIERPSMFGTMMQVHCFDCRVNGPFAYKRDMDTRDDAIRKWNALPRKKEEIVDPKAKK